MNPDILALTPIYGPTMAQLEDEFSVHKAWTAPDPDGFIRQVSGRVRGIVTTGIAGCTRHHVEALPKLEIIACFGTPHGTVDLEAAQARGIVVTKTPDFNTEHVADLALGLLLSVMRRITEGDRFARSGRWLSGYAPVGTGLSGKKCGILGLGRIGRCIARRVEACGMTVCYQGPHRKDDVSYAYYADPEAMAKDCDCLIVACWSSPATRGMVNARVLDALGPEGYLVNIARGPIIDEPALIAALKEHRIAGAGLDVYWEEPRIPQELPSMAHVVLTPHVGTNVREIREARGAKVLACLRAQFSGKPLPAEYIV